MSIRNGIFDEQFASIDKEFAKVGKRCRLWTVDMSQDLGFATYLWKGEYLLDIGRKISADECIAEEVPHSPVPPFDAMLKSAARVFEDNGRSLINTRSWLEKGFKIRFEEVAVKPWNHGGYVAGRIMLRNKPFWLIISEIEFVSQSHLKLVG